MKRSHCQCSHHPAQELQYRQTPKDAPLSPADFSTHPTPLKGKSLSWLYIHHFLALFAPDFEKPCFGVVIKWNLTAH